MMTGTSPNNIFISYGRQDAAEFVDKLVKDLQRAGFAVWRDTAELQSPRAWDAQIESAIKQADVVVAVLTPHSVRSGRGSESDGADSVCLDELAFARFSPPPTPIVPILLRHCEPPFVIYRLQYIDFLGATEDEARYGVALDELIRSINGLKTGIRPSYRGPKLEPLDFDLYLNLKTRGFVGREWLIDELFERLQRADGSTAVILACEPGWGKTSFTGHLFRTNPGGQLLAAHFCRADRADSIDPRRFVESLIAMTALRISSYQAAVTQRLPELEELLRANKAKDAFERLFLQELAKFDRKTLGVLPRYILVDGLDEAVGTSTQSTIATLLAQTIDLFPEWLHLVATSRDRPSILDEFGDATIMRLRPHDPRNRHDVQSMIAGLLGSSGVNNGAVQSTPASPDLIEMIAAKADGNALCAAQLALSARKCGMDVNAIAVLPRGLGALYQAIFKRRFDLRPAEWRTLRDILELIVVTRAPFPIAFAARVRGDAAEYATRDAIEEISDLLNLYDDKLRLFHQTLMEFLVHPGSPFFVNPKQGAERLLHFLNDRSGLKSLSQPLKEFCRQNFDDWLLQCQELARYSETLPQIYDDLFFSRPIEPLPYYVCGVTIRDRDRQLISYLAAGGLAETVASIISLAFVRAADRFRAAGADPWISRLGLPSPDEATTAAISRGINMSFEIACFGLGWTRALGQLAPELRPRLVQILNDKDAAALNWVFGWLDIAAGRDVLGISGYFEDQAGAIRSDWAEIEGELRRPNQA
ncbi:toll/interleukin-1 receptor domain-containing protein [Bradyrhizobium canariense]|uniref:TIR domain-containing protein n=1 Tax=Bradyrhizobium canariense TaxID=255045 RepID=A0A1X3FPB1_9BRAD|nr:toll/interleukin-1 receptor domain-containing protein [Bradyrhizobium canariense]OSI68570.1 hypothetical protein BSZ22_20595 [Bradyrhizobium canariense]OSI78018.1 hypothetical protein BSZ23_19595 [Bradyrhizobium canariense]OSI89248.1 hypothetical protein BSZ25_21065 [Bradyrhizobium canariense]OSI93730.1 hypothetical protein BSZ24_12295 [Bradyrhizobium canariense]OSJ03047.1 hypothetical protein BSZ16_16490 [Bradyrhizobium canariense]